MKALQHTLWVACSLLLMHFGAQGQGMSAEVTGYNPSLVSGMGSLGQSIVVINSSNEPKQTKINIEILGPNGEVWIKSHAWDEIGQGASTGMSLNFSSDFVLPEIQQSLNQFGRLPETRQSICVSVESGGKIEEKTCYNYQPQGFLAIENVNPLDESIVRSENPVFNWVLLGNQPYTHFIFLLGEKSDGGSKEMGKNLFRIVNQSQNLFYPLEAPNLKMEKEYIWKVQVYWNKELIGVSENWVFTLSEDTLEKEEFNYEYLDLNKSSQQPAVNIKGKLKLKKDNYQSSGQLTAKLVSPKGKEVKLPQHMTKLSYNVGSNYYVLDFYKEDVKLKHKGNYTLFIDDGINGTLEVNFTYYRPD